MLELDLVKNNGIIRCTNQTKEIIISALSFVKEIEGSRVILSPFKTSGTLQALKKRITNEK